MDYSESLGPNLPSHSSTNSARPSTTSTTTSDRSSPLTDTPQATAITLYTKPSCVQCTATKRLLDQRGLEYTQVDVTEDPDALAFVKDLGYQAAPVVYTVNTDTVGYDDIDHWSGFNADRIKAIVK